MFESQPPASLFTDLTSEDLDEWVSPRISSRGRNYQQQGLVSDLAQLENGSLIAWVAGTLRYATLVGMGESGLPDVSCTCPYELDCKHGVAVLLEYLEAVENHRKIPKISQDDVRLKLLMEGDLSDASENNTSSNSGNLSSKTVTFLKSKTKTQLITLLQEMALVHPVLALELSDRQQLISGNIQKLLQRLHDEIMVVTAEPCWQEEWGGGGGNIPDYSGIRKKMKALLKSEFNDEVLGLGKELIIRSHQQLESGNDNGDGFMEISSCIPTIVTALERSSLTAAEKLAWALDVVLSDDYGVFEEFHEYLLRKHPPSAWDTLADQLQEQLEKSHSKKIADSYHHNYNSDRISKWVIHALAHSNRDQEIIPFCEIEARKTGSYVRLVGLLIDEHRFKDAENWIKEGLVAIGDKWLGTAGTLQDQLQEIRIKEKNWPAVTALQVMGFVQQPSTNTFLECKKRSDKTNLWPKIREYLLLYLENGKVPWEQPGWNLPTTDLKLLGFNHKQKYPMRWELIDIAMLEKRPEQVLRWYDDLPRKHYDRYG
ncbi:MAG: SWIM zinc finger family protein, partial [Candidatus Marinimicrobia bacterium]|nr:SWIM zinc finger family protein [Candidatus Neomarinimicrobiota bacterium]